MTLLADDDKQFNVHNANYNIQGDIALVKESYVFIIKFALK